MEIGYPWPKGAAAWFVLTGAEPEFVRTTASVRLGSQFQLGQVVIKADAWVSAATVTAAFRQAQKRLLGRHNRPISERRMELFRFVNRHRDAADELPSWRQLFSDWNSQRRTWPYKNVRNFSRDYWSAARLLMFPDYEIGLRSRPRRVAK